MDRGFGRWSRLGVVAIVATGLGCGCAGEPEEDPVGVLQAAVRCRGQYNKLITTNFFGAHLGDLYYPDEIRHAAAAELVYSVPTSPGNERFAVAWVRKTDKKIYVRRWDTYTKSFLGGEQLLSSSTSPAGWIHTLGFDDNCQVIPGEATCAWFTWQDSAGQVRRGAVGANGGTYVGPSFYGYAPSGDAGVIYRWPGIYWRKKLLAYISRGGSTDRRQIRAKLLDESGTELSDQLLYTTAAGFRAYQTAVAWSSVEERWLVAWTENNWPDFSYKNGKVYVMYVGFDGDPGPAPDPLETDPNESDGPVMYCEGDWYQPKCEGAPSSASAPGGVQPLWNPLCTCKSIWLASSYYSTVKDGQGVVKDRYRLHNYGKVAQINAEGQRVGNPVTSDTCETWCPMTEAAFWYEGGFTPFQTMDYSLSAGTTHYRLLEDSGLPRIYAGPVTDDPYDTPQAFRSNGHVAVAVATDKSEQDPSPSPGLKLTIVDVHSGGCP
jgi:hypothetical protein